jgi:hypothetical protein
VIYEGHLAGVTVRIILKKDKQDWLGTYRRDLKKAGTYLGEHDFGDYVALYEAKSHREVTTLRLVAAGLEAELHSSPKKGEA